MIVIRPSDDRGHANHGWLDSRFTFSFGDWYDPNWMGFSDLRVINEDHIAPGTGFPEHPHREMEILTIVLDGKIAHKDSTGAGSSVGYGQFQLMSAGRGIAHSEFNPSPTDPTHLLQIWIVPDERGATPNYQESAVPPERWQNRWHTIAAPQGEGETLKIRANASVYIASLAKGEKLSVPYSADRIGWMQVAKGSVRIGEAIAGDGDGVAMIDEDTPPTIEATRDALVVYFDLRDPRRDA